MRKGLLVGLLGVLLLPVAVQAERPSDLWSTKSKTATAESAQTDTTLWDPDAGKRFVLQGVTACSDRAVRVDFEVSDLDVVNPLLLESYGCQTVTAGGSAIYMSEIDAILTYSTSASGHAVAHGFVSVFAWGYEAQ